MSKESIFIISPFIFGLMLLSISLYDLHQFDVGGIAVTEMLRREMPFFVLGILSSFCLFVKSIYWLWTRCWIKSFVSVFSILSFFVLFAVGGSLGAAYLNAT